MSVFGIDLGTCYSCVAKCDNNGNIEVKNDLKTSSPTTPSVVMFKDGVPVVGKAAKNSMANKPENCFSFVKREMNKEYLEQEIKIGELSRKVSPAEIQACILRYIFNNANTVVRNTDRESAVTQAVITVPAMFNDTQREKTKLAAQMAGIDVLALVQEPTAAAISYNIRHNETILVFDLGGGTLDVSIVRNEFGVHSVLGVPAGNPNLGGKDWDEALVNHVLKKKGLSLSSFSRSSKEWALLMKTAEDVKKDLTGMDEADFTIPIAPFDNVIVTRSEFETVTRSLVVKAMEIVDKAIANANAPTINRFVMVGGSSLMPMIKRSLEQRYSSKYANGRATKDWLVVSDPDQAIAKGAAKYAGMLAGLNKNNITIRDMATHSYGFRCYRSGTDTLIVLNKILSSDPIEINDRRFSLYTRYPNQTVLAITIIENDRTDDEFDFHDEPILIERNMQLPPNLPKDTEIFYVLNRDKNGIIDVHVECQGRELQFKAKEIVSCSIKQQIEETMREMRNAENS